MNNSKPIDRFIDANDVIIGDPGDESLKTFLEKTPLLDLVTHSDIPSEISIKSILGRAISYTTKLPGWSQVRKNGLAPFFYSDKLFSSKRCIYPLICPLNTSFEKSYAAPKRIQAL
ncbi:hypothetical protein SAMN04488118_1025 [Epibacterium ulvae]|uniref:Uncharacterized protein n=1 Tax=Epibacterium ulvae TaxID=1156985 RepID=A0A1G5PSX2_9RHOB|nr:hypothetical protein [Epibacterium ulvae]SCZ52488.1 hypothetical protein SAMN04488118_1025 [Epibacterium ulvae]